MHDADIANMKMFKEQENLFSETLKAPYNNNQYLLSNFEIPTWRPEDFKSGESISYEIKEYQILGFQTMNTPFSQNDSYRLSEKSKSFLQYLNFYELAIILLKDNESLKINPSFLFFSPYRGMSSNQSLQANLSSQSFNQALQEVHSGSSKKNTSLINIASIYFADKRRKFESAATPVGYEVLWKNDKEVQLMTEYLERLGYGWDLSLTDSNRNIYEIKLLKGGQQLLISQASSGEKEIINYLLGIFSLNITEGLIIIDEPQLHLHPRWQNLLLETCFMIYRS